MKLWLRHAVAKWSKKGVSKNCFQTYGFATRKERCCEYNAKRVITATMRDGFFFAKKKKNMDRFLFSCLLFFVALRKRSPFGNLLSTTLDCARSVTVGIRLIRVLVVGWTTSVSGALADGARPPFHGVDDQEPGVVRQGWQHEAASRVERDVRERRLMPRLADHERALLRTQSGPLAGQAFCAALPVF